MSNIENNATLLQLNKEAQVAALKAIGFNDATVDMSLSEIADYMRWAGGLRDLSIAVVGKTDGIVRCFTPEEWDALSATAKSENLRIGVRVRAEKQSFLIGKSDAPCYTDGSLTYRWAEEGVDVSGLKNYGAGSKGLYDDFDAKGMTDTVLAFAENRGKAYYVAQSAREYKALDVNVDGAEDPVEWSAPTAAHMRILYRYRTQINDFINTYLGTSYALQSTFYWTINEYSSSNAWRIHLGSGAFINGYYKNHSGGTYRVRAVSAI